MTTKARALASYHLSAQPVKRSEGRSVVAMAAYRAGERLADQRCNEHADYRRRRGVVHSEILLPDGGAAFLSSRELLWNYVESIERRTDAQLAREINVALPHELTDEQRLELVRRFVRNEFVSLGMVADVAIHRPVPEKGDDPRNHHAHIMLTLRQATATGLRPVKTREWNSDAMLARWRKAWAELQNEALRERGHRERVDHRSLAAQRAEAKEQGHHREALLLSREPELHVGPKARKAGYGNTPHSHDRWVGPYRQGDVGMRRRLRLYTVTDSGSRGEANIRRLAKNARYLEMLSRKAERHLTLLRKRQMYFERLKREQARQDAEAWRADALRPSSVHVQRRCAQIAYWVDQLDRLFRVLIAFRESQLLRETVWANRLRRWRPNSVRQGRGGARRKGRHPSLL